MTKLEELAVGAAKNMASMLAEAHGDLHNLLQALKDTPSLTPVQKANYAKQLESG